MLVRISSGLFGLFGAATLLAGCGDAIPPAPQGAVSVFVEPLMLCGTATGDWDNIPYLDNGQVPISSSTVNQEGIDGDGQIKISCTVAPSGSGFLFSASASDKGAYSVTLSAMQISAGTPAPGQVTVKTPNTNGVYRSPAAKPCLFNVTGGIDAGNIWGSVTCDTIEDDSMATTTGAPQCTVNTGYFRFENCNGG